MFYFGTYLITTSNRVQISILEIENSVDHVLRMIIKQFCYGKIRFAALAPGGHFLYLSKLTFVSATDGL